MFCISESVIRKLIHGKAKTFYFLFLFLSPFLIQCAHQEKLSDSLREPAATKTVNNLQRYAFEQCRSNSRLYLEGQILKLPAEYYQSHQDEWSQRIPLSCFQFAQRNYVGHYAACESETARPTTTAQRPCLTENYVLLVSNAYHDVMDCFNLNPKDFYLQIMIESGFHINAINKTGFDSGMAQFTANGIKKVIAHNLFQRTQDILLGSSRASCARISSIVKSFDIDAFSLKNRCSMISLPSNPYRAMLFNYLHTMLDQIAIEKLIVETKDLAPIANDKIKKHLVYLAYNRGIKGTNDLLNGYIISRKNMNHQLVAEDFELDKNLSHVKNILRMDSDKRKQLRLAKKIKNLSFAEYAIIHGVTYVSDMAAADEQVRRYLGDQCGGLE